MNCFFPEKVYQRIVDFKKPNYKRYHDQGKQNKNYVKAAQDTEYLFLRVRHLSYFFPEKVYQRYLAKSQIPVGIINSRTQLLSGKNIKVIPLVKLYMDLHHITEYGNIIWEFFSLKAMISKVSQCVFCESALLWLSWALLQLTYSAYIWECGYF